MEKGRKSRKEASIHEEKRRMAEPLCMFNSYSCAGSVTSHERSGVAFGSQFQTIDVLCEYHIEHPPTPKPRQSKPAPVNQPPLPL